LPKLSGRAEGNRKDLYKETKVSEKFEDVGLLALKLKEIALSQEM